LLKPFKISNALGTPKELQLVFDFGNFGIYGNPAESQLVQSGQPEAGLCGAML